MEKEALQMALQRHGFYEELPRDAVPLVRHLMSDLASLKSQLSDGQARVADLEERHQRQAGLVAPLVQENERLLSDANDAYGRIYELEDAQSLIPEPVPMPHRGPRPFGAELHALESELHNMRTYAAELTKQKDSLRTTVASLRNRNKELEEELTKSRPPRTPRGGDAMKAMSLRISKLEADVKSRDAEVAHLESLIAERDRALAKLSIGTSRSERNLDEEEGETSFSVTNPAPRGLVSADQGYRGSLFDDDDDAPIADGIVPEPYYPLPDDNVSNGDALTRYSGDQPDVFSDESIRPDVSTPAEQRVISPSPSRDVATSHFQSKGYQQTLRPAEDQPFVRYSRSSSPNTVHPCAMAPRSQIECPVDGSVAIYTPTIRQSSSSCSECARLTAENTLLKQQITGLNTEITRFRMAQGAGKSLSATKAGDSSLQDQQNIVTTLQAELDMCRSHIDRLRYEYSQLSERLSKQQVENADLATANATLTALTGKLEEKVAHQVETIVKLKDSLKEYEGHTEALGKKLRQKSLELRKVEKQVAMEKDKVVDLKARLSIDSTAMKGLGQANKKMSQMMAQLAVENRQLRQDVALAGRQHSVPTAEPDLELNEDCSETIEEYPPNVDELVRQYADDVI